MAMNEKLVAPLAFTVIGGAVTNGDNLKNERLGRVATLNNVVIDLGSALPVDSVAMLASNAPVGTVWRVRAYANSADAVAQNNNQIFDGATVNFLASAEGAKRLHRQSLCLISTPVTARYWLVQISTQITAGRLVIGQAFTALDTMDMGGSFKIVDLGEARRSSTALENPTVRGKALEYSWTWSWMTEAEARGTLLDLLAYAGITRDVMCVLNPDAADLHNMIGYGKFQEEVEPTQVAGGLGVTNAYEAKLRLQSRLLLNL